MGSLSLLFTFLTTTMTGGYNKQEHLKNVGPISIFCVYVMIWALLPEIKPMMMMMIRHNEPPHAHSADVASGTVARRLRIDVHDDDDNDNDNA